MLHQPAETFVAHPASQWTGEIKTLFLEALSQRGNVSAACRRVGLSTETAYRQRRRDSVFARAWAAAMALGRRVTEEALADRAIDGIEEDVWYRGEVVGTRRKYDNRLLLAHMARLDAAVTEEAQADADRFDELLALIAGEKPPEGSEIDGSALMERDVFIACAGEAAREEVEEEWSTRRDEDGELAEEDASAYLIQRLEAGVLACNRAADEWNGWLARAHGRVDSIAGTPAAEPREPVVQICPRTPSTPSTPTAALATAGAADGSGEPTVERAEPGPGRWALFYKQNRDASVPRVLGVVGDQGLAVGDALDAAEAVVADPGADQ